MSDTTPKTVEAPTVQVEAETEADLFNNVINSVPDFADGGFDVSSKPESKVPADPDTVADVGDLTEPTEPIDSLEPVEPAKPEEPKETDSNDWVEFIKKDKQLRLERQAFKQERETWEAQQKTTAESSDAFKAKLRANPLDALREVGISFDDLAMTVIQGTPQIKEPVESTKASENDEIAQIKKEIAQLKEEKRQMEFKQSLSGFQTTVSNLINETPELALLKSHPNPTQAILDYAEYYKSDIGPLPPDLTIDKIAVNVLEGWKQELSQLKSNTAVLEYLGVTSNPAGKPKSQKETPVNLPKKTPIKQPDSDPEDALDDLTVLVNSLPDDLWNDGGF